MKALDKHWVEKGAKERGLSPKSLERNRGSYRSSSGHGWDRLLILRIHRCLTPRLAPVVVTYPVDRSMNYAELEQLARASLPTERPFVLVGESFSGPIAISLAASKPATLRGLVVVCSFARSPIPKPSGLSSVISRLPVKLIPTRITAALLLGRYASRALRERLSAAISKVDPVV